MKARRSHHYEGGSHHHEANPYAMVIMKAVPDCHRAIIMKVVPTNHDYEGEFIISGDHEVVVIIVTNNI